MREVAVDKAIYLVDDSNRTYSFLRRNPNWSKLSPSQNTKNKQSLNGYIRHLRGGGTKVFKLSKNLYRCPECGLHYENEEIAKQCEAWCSEHKSCNLEITRFSVEAASDQGLSQ
ncbi:hypothetical protein A3D14_03310 [Candidatus Saccharibacteria bacterium RIFCSPHIGHO2_02_FULL_47_12]|nr:MAG: hypothetical protein A3D14_03310 [Candidatus Saccharibacteria bacterium RIFCSPHIGHO2_02_FULL_47_12]